MINTKTSLRVKNTYFLALLLFNSVLFLLFGVIWLVLKLQNPSNVINPTQEVIDQLAFLSTMEFWFIGSVFLMSLLFFFQFLVFDAYKYRKSQKRIFVYISNFQYFMCMVLLAGFAYVFLSVFELYSKPSDYIVYNGWYRFILSIISVSFAISMIVSIVLNFRFTSILRGKENYEYK